MSASARIRKFNGERRSREPEASAEGEGGRSPWNLRGRVLMRPQAEVPRGSPTTPADSRTGVPGEVAREDLLRRCASDLSATTMTLMWPVLSLRTSVDAQRRHQSCLGDRALRHSSSSDGSAAHPTPLIARCSKKMQFCGQANGTACAMSIRHRSTLPPGVVRDE